MCITFEKHGIRGLLPIWREISTGLFQGPPLFLIFTETHKRILKSPHQIPSAINLEGNNYTSISLEETSLTADHVKR